MNMPSRGPNVIKRRRSGYAVYDRSSNLQYLLARRGVRTGRGPARALCVSNIESTDISARRTYYRVRGQPAKLEMPDKPLVYCVHEK